MLSVDETLIVYSVNQSLLRTRFYILHKKREKVSACIYMYVKKQLHYKLNCEISHKMFQFLVHTAQNKIEISSHFCMRCTGFHIWTCYIRILWNTLKLFWVLWHSSTSRLLSMEVFVFEKSCLINWNTFDGLIWMWTCMAKTKFHSKNNKIHKTHIRLKI